MELAQLLHLQSGVVARRQLIEAGLAPHDIRRLERRRELNRIHTAVYVDHTGVPSWLQRAWAGVLFAWPAALGHESALRALDGPGRPAVEATIHVAIDRQRSLKAPSGVRLHRVTELEKAALWNTSPPRLRTELAVLHLACRAVDDFGAVQEIADAVQSRRTTAARLLETLNALERLPRRRFLALVLADVSAGACSVLEHGYLSRVERAHALPAAARQVRDSIRGPVYRDVLYEPWRLAVELDGRQFHGSAAAHRDDLDRDLDAAARGLLTVRLGWGQVFGSPCRTAEQLARLLRERGWQGSIRGCPDC